MLQVIYINLKLNNLYVVISAIDNVKYIRVLSISHTILYDIVLIICYITCKKAVYTFAI